MSILADGRASLAALGIDQWQGGYPHRAVIEDDTARGDSYVVEADDRIVATAMIGFSGERDYDRIEEARGSLPARPSVRATAWCTEWPWLPTGRIAAPRRFCWLAPKSWRARTEAPASASTRTPQRAYEKAAGESRL